ncbi:MAG: lysophospholipase [Actinomycetota bacterium]|nr:lysophospholipase [Actinomycetota bacterium]
MPKAELRWDETPDQPDAVVLVLHGGQEDSERETRWSNLAVLRMWPIARSIARAGGGRLAVARLRYAVRGWNGATASPLADARQALDDIAARYPGVPIALVGHSMGGRVALRLSGDPRVSGIVGLAPWIERHDGARPHPVLRLLVIHGLDDRMTSPTASRGTVISLQGRGGLASFVGLKSEKHAMLRRWRAWDQLTAGFLTRALTGDLPDRPHGPLGELGSRAATEPVVTVV